MFNFFNIINSIYQSFDIWLSHVQEELMDAVNYIEKTRMVLREEIEECYIRDAKKEEE